MSSSSKRPILVFVLGLAVGGLFGGIAGYVINDLTSKENEEVIAEIEDNEARQQSLEDQFSRMEAEAAATRSTSGSGDASE